MQVFHNFLASVGDDVKSSIKPNLAFNATKSDDELLVLVHGVIGDDIDALDSASLVSEISGFSGSRIRLDINTPGGSVFDAMSVYNALVQTRADVIADVTGTAYSAGTIIASAADTIRISAGAQWMIHRAWAMAMGNAPAMHEAAEMLERADEQIAALLAERSGNTFESIVSWMSGAIDGTTFTGEEAVSRGFADELIPLKAKAGKSQPSQRRFYEVAAQVAWARLNAKRS